MFYVFVNPEGRWFQSKEKDVGTDRVGVVRVVVTHSRPSCRVHSVVLTYQSLTDIPRQGPRSGGGLVLDSVPGPKEEPPDTVGSCVRLLSDTPSSPPLPFLTRPYTQYQNRGGYRTTSGTTLSDDGRRPGPGSHPWTVSAGLILHRGSRDSTDER